MKKYLGVCVFIAAASMTLLTGCKSSSSKPATTGGTAGSSITTEKAPSNAPKGATAQCKDKTFSTNKEHAGSCSGHGGVAAWIKH